MRARRARAYGHSRACGHAVLQAALRPARRQRGDPALGSQLWAKECKAEGRCCIACRNEAAAEKDAVDRRAVVDALDQQLKRGNKALVGNSACRRYVRTTSDARAFEIDPGKLADEARYDGVLVPRTNARLTPLQAVLRCRDLVRMGQLFRAAKSAVGHDRAGRQDLDCTHPSRWMCLCPAAGCRHRPTISAKKRSTSLSQFEPGG